MCDPITALAVTSAAVSTAGAVAGYIGQGQARQDNTQAANLGYAANMNTLATRGEEIDQAQSENHVNAVIAQAQARGKVSADASSFGGDASSTARQVNAGDFSVGQQLGREDINSTNSRVQVATDQTGEFYKRQSQINQVAAPNPLSLGISIAGSALQGASTYSKLGGKF